MNYIFTYIDNILLLEYNEKSNKSISQTSIEPYSWFRRSYKFRCFK